MLFLLIKTEILPHSQSSWLAIPPEHIIQMIFTHEEDSELGIYNANFKIGNFRISPRKEKNQDNRLRYSGDFILQSPISKPQRVYIDGWVVTQPDLTLKSFELRILLRNPLLTLEIKTSNETGTFEYKLIQNEEVIREDSGNIADILKENSLNSLGLDPGFFLKANSNIQVTARRADLRIRKEQIEVYRLLITHSDSLHTEIDISQIGRLLRVKTFLGYEMLAEGLEP